MCRPNLFIVGAPKCGTTFMHEYLKVHPQVFMSSVKEPYYFGSDLVYLKLRRPTEEAYLSLFSDAGDAKVIGEASVTYLVSQRAAEEIKAFSPDARAIIMLRNPVDTMYSMHSQALFTTVEDVEDFATALSLEESRKHGSNIPPETTILSFILYRELVRYTDQVERYFRALGRERVQVIIHDDFKRDSAGVYRQTLRFLGVDEDFQPKSFAVINPNKRRRNEWFRKLAVNPRVVSGMRALLPSYAVRQAIARKLAFVTVSHERRAPLDPAFRNQLQAEFRPEIERLSSLLNRDLTHWCQTDVSSRE